MYDLGFGLIFSLKDDFSANAQHIKKEFANLAGVTDQFSQKVNNSMQAMQLGAMSLGLGAALTAPLLHATNKASEFEAQMSSVYSVMSGNEVKKYSKDLEQLALVMGEKTKFSAIQAGQGIEELVKAGVPLEAIMKDGLKGALDLAVAGSIDLASAATIASTALNAFKRDNLSVTQAANILAGTANVSASSVESLKFGLSQVSAVASGVGMTFQDTAVALGLFANNGLMGSDAGTSLKTALLNLQPTTKEQISLFRQLGLLTADGANQFFTAEGKIKSLAQISGVLQNTFKGMTDQQRLLKMEMLFGSDAIRAINVLFNEGEAGARKFAEQMGAITAEGTAKTKMDNLKGAVEELRGSIETFWIALGQSKTGLFKNLVNVMQSGVSVASQFIRTPLGQFIFDVVSAVGLLVGGLGAYLVVSSSVTLLSTQASLAFARLGLSAVSTAFATNGLVGGFRALGIAALQAMIPLLPYIAVGALVGGAIYFAYESFRSFQAVMSGAVAPARGLLGFMQRLGGVLWSVGQVLSSWDGKSFNLGGMEASLQSLGILDFVLNLSTWITRLYEFVRGVGQAFYEVFSFASGVVASAYNYIVGAINSFANALGFQGTWLGKATSDIQNWLYWGRVLGYTIMGVLVVGFTYLASAVLLATWPFLAIAGAVAGLIYLIYNWRNVVDVVSKAIGTAFNYIANQMTRDISIALLWLATNVPKWLGEAFGWALGAVRVLLTEFVPWVLTKFIEMQLWVAQNIPYWFGQAFLLAFNYIVWHFTVFLPAMVGYLQSFLWWVVQNVPYLLLSAFASAFIFVLNLAGQFLYQLGRFFWDFGVSLVQNMKEGIWSVWETFKTWFANLVSASFDIGAMLGLTEAQTPATAGGSPTRGMAGLGQNSLSAIGTSAQTAQFRAIQPTVLDRTLVTQEKPNISVYVGGEQLYDIMTKQGELEKARK